MSSPQGGEGCPGVLCVDDVEPTRWSYGVLPGSFCVDDLSSDAECFRSSSLPPIWVL